MEWPDVRLVVCLSCSCSALVLVFGWTFVLPRSPVGMFLMFLSQWIRREPREINAPIVKPTHSRSFRDTVLPAQSYDFDDALNRQPTPPAGPGTPFRAQSAPPPPYPRPLTEEEIDHPRPFLRMGLDPDEDE
jgi:hypothetical protein